MIQFSYLCISELDIHRLEITNKDIWKANKQERVSFAEDNSNRKQRIKETCRRKDIISKYKFTFDRDVEKKIYASSKANFTWCKVGKAGSTLITRLFLLSIGKSLEEAAAQSAFYANFRKARIWM